MALTRERYLEWNPSQRARFRKRSPAPVNKLPSRAAAKPPAPRPPAAPAPTAAPAQPQQPFNATYEARQSSITRDTANSEAEVTAQEAQVKQEYGFDDVSNPFNRAAMLQRSYAQSQARQMNTAGNQLYSGSQENATTEGRFQHDQSYDTLRRDYSGQLDQLKARRATIQREAEQRRIDAEAERVNSALADRATAEEAPAPAAGPRIIPAYYHNLSPAAKRRWWAKGR